MIVAVSAGRDSPAELRSRLALDTEGVRALLRAERPGIGELVVLSTCHRTELYGATEDPEADGPALLTSLLDLADPRDLRVLVGAECVEHLFRVASGLDSLVVGEQQILAQVRRALVLAQEEGTAGPVMANVFGRAIRVGRRVRSETSLGSIATTVGAIAARHLAHHLGGLDGRRGTVVGAGKAARDAARSVSEMGARISVVSRTPSSARRLATELDVAYHPLDELPAVLDAGDFAVVAVSGGPLVDAASLPTRTAAEPFVVLDLSVPPAVDAHGRDDVWMRTLEEIPGPRGPRVTKAVVEAEALVRGEAAKADTRPGPAIRELRTMAEDVVRAELERTFGGAGLSPDQQEKVKVMATRIANKLMHGPSERLREADETTRELILRMFRGD